MPDPGSFSEDALDKAHAIFNFATCQRSDGSTYGTSGQCRKGVEITKVETGIFQVKDSSGKVVGHIRTAVGGGAVEIGEGKSTARYDAKIGDKKKEGMTLAQAKTWVKEQLGEKTGGDAKVAIKGGLTAKGKEKRLENIKRELSEVREEFNSQVSRWNTIPKEERKNHANLKKNIEFLKNKYEALAAQRKAIEGIPVIES